MLTWPPNSLDLTSLRCAAKRSVIHDIPTSQLTEFKGSAAVVFVPDTTIKVQGSVELIPQRVRAALVAWNELHNIRQGVLMLWLISVYINALIQALMAACISGSFPYCLTECQLYSNLMLYHPHTPLGQSELTSVKSNQRLAYDHLFTRILTVFILFHDTTV